ncbi:putative aldose 1-epimerase [Tripterygium wilfordii]|uniref:glucose-6-phosphate 1-epimerase n=1 Tax=Tripterygium wilfordii TaxID=458696 RepID=A0A7J7C7E4_TRIWF|nr:putative aldose 1-epimerase [Tripterygium wilfordii]
MNHSGTERAAAVEVTKDKFGVDQVLLRNPRRASVRVSLHGGQIRSWRTERGEELLFTSSKCEEEFLYAFHRYILQCLCDNSLLSGLDVWLIDGFYCLFEFRLRVALTVEGNLTMISRIRNIDCKPFSFSIAYHTYFSISDISEVRIEGLETLDYLDNLCQRERFTEQGDALTFESEVDRVYLSSSDAVAVFDHKKKRTFVIKKEGLPDVVVWNPWEKNAKSLVDFGEEEYKQMLCVDGAAIEKPITLKPGEEWKGQLELAVVPSS